MDAQRTHTDIKAREHLVLREGRLVAIRQLRDHAQSPSAWHNRRYMETESENTYNEYYGGVRRRTRKSRPMHITYYICMYVVYTHDQVVRYVRDAHDVQNT